MKEDTLEKMQERLDILEDLVSGDEARRIPGLARNVEEMQKDFDEFKQVWNRRADMFKGILWALGGNGLLGIIALIMQIFGIGG